LWANQRSISVSWSAYLVVGLKNLVISNKTGRINTVYHII
jgi:hypothetical protein